ncbi:Ig-like domain-containing protein, partial [Pseudomonas fluorescens]|uniref:Ig-like domain-containing protein n=1 Tax=Pseudomonas fluorescens TaxID=294 RepID=UPI001781F5F3
KTTVSANTVSAVVALVADASTSTVTALSASPTSIVADDAATSTLSATVRDGNGNLLPTGQVVTFTTNLGTLSAGTAATNAAGVASVTLRGSSAGTATVTAKAKSATTQTASVTLTSAAPVISTFAVVGRGSAIKNATNGAVAVEGDVSIYENNAFSWVATGADRYVIVDAWGSTLYSGTATSFNTNGLRVPNNTNLHFNTGNPYFNSTMTLRAYNGALVSEQTINIRYYIWYCTGGCSGS